MQNQTQKMRKEYLYTALMCIGITLLIVILIIAGGCEPQTKDSSGGDGDGSSTASPSGTTSNEGSKSESQGNIDISVPEGPVEFITVKYPSAQKMTGILALTDPDYMATVTEEPSELKNIAKLMNGLYGLSGYNLCLNEDAIKALNELIEAFEESKGENNLIVHEAYVAGASLTDSPFRKDLSNGNTVYFSIFPRDEDGESIGNGKYVWLVDNCNRFGYIARYPSEKAAITQVTGSESGKIYRYVGYEHAAYMAEWHLCLEEYIDAVRNATFDEPLAISYKNESGDQKTCKVYYIPAADGEETELKIRGGEGAEYSVSGDGSRGFIITCYE